MRSQAIALSFLCSILMGATTTATSNEAPVTAKLTGQWQNHDLRVTLVLTNDTGNPYPLLKWDIPSSEGTSDLFSVFRDSERLPYAGALVKRIVTHDSFIYLQPHHPYSVTVSLKSLYHVDATAPAVYRIRYEAWNQNPPDQPVRNEVIKSNETIVEVKPGDL